MEIIDVFTDFLQVPTMKTKPKLIKERVFVISIPVYGDKKISVVFTKDIITSRKNRCELFGEYKSGQTIPQTSSGALTSSYGGNIYLFIHPQYPAGTLVHECYHLAYEVLDFMGVYPCNETAEVFAYLIEYLFDKIKSLK